MADSEIETYGPRDDLMIDLLTEYRRHLVSAESYLAEATADPADVVDDQDDEAGDGSHLTSAQAQAAADTHARLAQAAATALTAIAQVDAARTAARAVAAPAALVG